MGRVDEAMRRAAEAARTGRPTADPASPVAPDLDPALVTSEVFPVESSGHSPASEAAVRSIIETPVPITDPAGTRC